MTRIISIIGGKGGVGKTTLTSNLACALADIGHNVVAIDANLTTPNLGLHLGMHLSPKTLHHVLKNEARLSEAMYPHPFGFKVVPGSMAVKDLEGLDVSNLAAVPLSLVGQADYVLLDCAAGLGREAVSGLDAADETILITNPDLPSLTDALKTATIAEASQKRVLGVVVNRVKGKWHEVSNRDIEEMLGVPVLAEIPEDRSIQQSISLKMPLVGYDPYSPASEQFKRLAHYISGKPYIELKRNTGVTFLQKLIQWMVG